MGAKQRRIREKEMRRGQILDAARALLFEKGVGAVSMNQIAEAAELSVGTLYLYFKNKEDLFAALQEEGLDKLFDLVQSAGEGVDDPREKVRRMALAYKDFSEKDRKYFEIIDYFLVSPGVKFPADLKSRIDRHGGRILDIVESAIARCLPEGKRKEGRRYAILFWAACHGMLDLRKLQTTILSGHPFPDLYLHGIDHFLRNLNPPKGKGGVAEKS